MNWRRGAVLATVNVAAVLAVVVPVHLSMTDALKRYYEYQSERASDPLNSPGFYDLCKVFGATPLPPMLTLMGNLPVAVATGWANPCPPRWSLAGMMHGTGFYVQSPHSYTTQRRGDCIVVILIAIQWLLLGALPTLRHRRWWLEPGAFITVGIVVTTLIYYYPSPFVSYDAQWPLLIVWWLGAFGSHAACTQASGISGHALADTLHQRRRERTSLRRLLRLPMQRCL